MVDGWQQKTKEVSMGLMDRDYMHEKRRERPFSPPPERFKLGTLGMVLVYVGVLFFLYKVAGWKLNHRAAERVSPPIAESVRNTVPQPMQTPTQPLPVQPAHVYSNTPNATAGITPVAKCIVNGKTSYSDGSCPEGSVSSHIVTRDNHNLMAAVRPEAVQQTQSPVNPYRTEVQTHFFNPAAAQKSECQALEAQIQHWDAMARQPQSGQMQDWIREQRNRARDRQFSIRCP